MKRIIATALTIITLLLALTGCSQGSDAPEGMQLVRGSDAIGYYFYSPIGWIVASQGNIASSYVSTIDSTSVTLVEAKMPEGSIKDYFEAAKADFTFEITVKNEGGEPIATKLGNAEEAYQYIYDYEYSGFKFRTIQIFAKFEGRFYIFTFTAQLTERTEGESYYDFHFAKSFQSIVENVKFVTKSGTEPAPEYTEVDGYLLVSDKKLCGFDMYVPKDYKVDYSDGIVSVTREDGANITVSKSTATGVTIKDYWANRKKELEAIVGTVTEIEVNKSEGVTLGNLATAASYEYTYELGGVKYHVYQVFAVDTFEGYAFTFTAPEAVYAERIGEARDIAARLEF
jgi:hypothetical protein